MHDRRKIMGLLSRISGMLVVALAALAGNWVGDNLRAASGAPAHRLSLTHMTSDGQLAFGLNVALTNFVPALLLALLAGKPRSLYAFVSGAIISALVGDSYEQALAAWLHGAEHVYAKARVSL
jgi:hypothetical protein